MLRAFLDILFPPLCHACRAFIAEPTPMHLCADCRMLIVPIGSPFCPICGVPFATEGGSNHPCGACLTNRRPFSAARAAVRFDGPVQDLIHRCKYGKKVHLAKPLALLMAESLTTFVSDAVPDCLVPVPLHGKRLRQRGFNQAQQLAGFLAKRWQLPHSVDNLRRIRWTEPQTGLAAVDRQRNIRDAFAVRDPGRFKDKRLLLVDDVYTTGSTAAECARTLRHAGASSVMVITVARAVI
jgi:ComF family protein